MTADEGGQETHHLLATRLEKLEDRFAGVERAAGLLGQQVQMAAEVTHELMQKLHGVNGSPGLVVRVDRLENLNVDKRFESLGKDVESLKQWQAKIVGASVLGGAIATFVGEAILSLFRH